MLTSEAVAQLQGAEAGGFDLSPGQSLHLINEGARRLAARSEWIKELVELGPTVANQATYAVPDAAIELDLISIGGTPYDKKGIRTLFEVKAGIRQLVGVGGIFAQTYNSSGSQKNFEVYPAPDSSGASIQGLASILPADLGLDDALPFPEDLARAVIDAAKAVAYEDVDENPQMASYYDAKVDDWSEELRRRSNARTGSGPVQIRLTR